MTTEPYRKILALPGVRTLLLVGLLARIPVTAMGIALILHVVNTLGLGFAQAGLVGAASTVGAAIGAPLAGRLVDRHGLRPVLITATVAQALFWATAPGLPYQMLLIAATVAGMLSLPVFSVIRQCVAAMVPADQRRSGFALDSMGVELSYMIGPAGAVTAVTQVGSTITMYAVGAGLVAAGIALIRLDPPTRSATESADDVDDVAIPRRQWLRPGLIALMAVSSVLTFVLTATDLALVATLKHAGATAWTGLVIGAWCAYSLIGGFIYGTLTRSLSPLLLTAALCALTMPVGLVGGGWWWLCLLMLPAGLLCAPALSATVDTVSRGVPSAARGEAMGLHATALTIGVAAGGPFAGAVIDAYGPEWAFAAAGTAGLLLVLLAVPFWQHTDPAPAAEVAAEPLTPVGAAAAG